MATEWISVALGGVTTLLGGLGGAIIASRHAAKSERNAAAKEARIEQRDHAIEVIDAGREWASSLSALSLAMGTVQDPDTLTRMDTWTAHAPKLTRYKRALSAADLILADGSAHQAVSRLRQDLSTQSSVTERVMSETMGAGRASKEAMEALWAYCDHHQEVLDDFVAVAKARLVQEQ